MTPTPSLIGIGSLACASSIWPSVEHVCNIVAVTATGTTLVGFVLWLAYQLDLFDRWLDPDPPASAPVGREHVTAGVPR